MEVIRLQYMGIIIYFEMEKYPILYKTLFGSNAGLYNGIEYLADNTLIENIVINYPRRKESCNYMIHKYLNHQL